jgi:hypothetical protein
VLPAPAISVAGASFSLSGPAPSGLLLPTQTASFDVQFAPATAGILNGSLTLGDRACALTGTGIDPALPKPRLVVSLQTAESAQQGTVAVALDAAAKTSGQGTVTLAFAPSIPGAAEPAVAFDTGGQTVTFTLSPGDLQAHFGARLTALFQTGTTAGTLTLTATLAGGTDRQAIVIPPAPIGITAANCVASAAIP